MVSKATAICCTTGRLNVLPESVKCFLDQDYSNKELLILNDHVGYPLKLQEEDSRIKIYNYDKGFTSLGAKRNAGKELATGDFIFIWEDDDLSTPWRMSESIRLLQENPSYDAVKVKSVIYSTNNSNFAITRSSHYEGSACFRSSFLKEQEYPEENVIVDLEVEKNANILIIDPEPLHWYSYRWGLDIYHISGRPDNGAGTGVDNYQAALSYLKTDLGNTIIPVFTENHWLNITQWIKKEFDIDYYNKWYQKIVNYL